MKKAISIGVLASAFAVSGIIIAQPKDDSQVIDDAVGNLQAGDLVGPSPTPPAGPADLNKATVLLIVAELKDPEKNGGFIKIAYRHGVSPEQVRAIWKRMQKRLQELAESEPIP